MTRVWVLYLVLFCTALVCSLICTPVARRIAWKVGSVDMPGGRRINRTPLPRMGGIAVFVALLVSLGVSALLASRYAMLEPLGFSLTRPHRFNYLFLLAALVVIFVTGLIDDRMSLTPKQKLVGQILAAVLAVRAGLSIDVVVNPLNESAIHLSWFAWPLTVLYLVAYTNIFNLIDGLDGLASGIACIAGITMWIISTLQGHADAAALALSLAGATLGFLRYNFNPASIILGDSGSLLIGFVLGSVSLMSVQRVAGLTSIIVPLVIAFIPIIDTFSAIVRRGRAHVSIGQADKGHIHHRLMQEGFNQRQTVVLIYAWTLVLCTGSVVMTQVTVLPRIFIFLILIFASVLFSLRLHLFRPVLLHHYNPETGADELIAPQDPDFAHEEEKFEEDHFSF